MLHTLSLFQIKLGWFVTTCLYRY